MSQVLVSTKYQVVIPKEVRRSLNIKSGQKMSCIVINGVIHLVPSRPLSSLRGFVKGISLEGLREKKDREI
jgi:AbrB family looped-hinge helix DNA binding protein